MSPAARGAGLALTLCLAAVLACSDPVQRDGPPNVVFILADDLGWRDTGQGGSRFYETPHIDGLAREGLVFENAYAAAPICSPSRAALLTGHHPARLRLTDNVTRPPRASQSAGRRARAESRRLAPPASAQRLPDAEITLAEALGAAGYATAFIGKWHLGAPPATPASQGFETAIGVGYGAHLKSYFAPYGIEGLEGPPGEYLSDRLTDEALRFIEAHRNERFLLFLSHFAIHGPWQGKPELVERYRRRVREGDEQRNPVVAAMIHSLDESVGRILACLDALGLAQDTLVIFTSDNGGLERSPLRRQRITSNAPLRGGKATLWEGGIRVPQILRWSAAIAPGTTAVPVVSLDLFPTVLELAGLGHAAPASLDGESLVPLLRRSGELSQRALYFYYPHYTNHAAPSAALRRGSFKFIRSFEGPLELYDLELDPGEEQNLATERPALTRELASELESWLERIDAQPPTERSDPG